MYNSPEYHDWGIMVYLDLMNETQKQKHFTLLQAGHKQGYTTDTIGLGKCYEFGIGVERDAKMAFSLYEDAYNKYKLEPEKRDSHACIYLAYCYQHGVGGKQNLKYAKKLYREVGGDCYAPMFTDNEKKLMIGIACILMIASAVYLYRNPDSISKACTSLKNGIGGIIELPIIKPACKFAKSTLTYLADAVSSGARVA